MSNFFQKVMDERLLDNLPAILDWLFDDKKFDGPAWTAGTKRKFTNKVLKLEGFSKATFKKKTNGDSYPKAHVKCARPQKPYAMFSSNTSLGQDFVRHIRNGIAHGRATPFKSGGKDYVEITDWGTRRTKNGDRVQTAYITIPLSHLNSILRIYREVEQGSSYKKKGRKKCSD